MSSDALDLLGGWRYETVLGVVFSGVFTFDSIHSSTVIGPDALSHPPELQDAIRLR